MNTFYLSEHLKLSLVTSFAGTCTVFMTTIKTISSPLTRTTYRILVSLPSVSLRSILIFLNVHVRVETRLELSLPDHVRKTLTKHCQVFGLEYHGKLQASHPIVCSFYSWFCQL